MPSRWRAAGPPAVARRARARAGPARRLTPLERRRGPRGFGGNDLHGHRYGLARVWESGGYGINAAGCRPGDRLVVPVGDVTFPCPGHYKPRERARPAPATRSCTATTSIQPAS